MAPDPDEVDAMAILFRLRLPVALRGVLRAGVASDVVEMFNLNVNNRLELSKKTK